MQITRNILASWQVQHSMHSEVKKVLEMAKRKKRNERVVRLVDAAARGNITEVLLKPICCCGQPDAFHREMGLSVQLHIRLASIPFSVLIVVKELL